MPKDEFVDTEEDRRKEKNVKAKYPAAMPGEIFLPCEAVSVKQADQGANGNGEEQQFTCHAAHGKKGQDEGRRDKEKKACGYGDLSQEPVGFRKPVFNPAENKQCAEQHQQRSADHMYI